MNDFAFVVVCDLSSKSKGFFWQTYRWLLSNKFSSIENLVDLHVGIVGSLTGGERYLFEQLGCIVHLLNSDSLTDQHGPSKKLLITQILGLDKYKSVTLMDTDTIVTNHPVKLFQESLIQAKIADMPTASKDTIIVTAEFCDIQYDESVQTQFLNGIEGYLYCNSGIVNMPGQDYYIFLNIWKNINDELLENIQIIPEAERYHVDQISLALALSKFGINKFKELPIDYNFPTHLPEIYYHNIKGESVEIIHYHHQVSNDGLIRHRFDLPTVNRYISSFNNLYSSYVSYLLNRKLGVLNESEPSKTASKRFQLSSAFSWLLAGVTEGSSETSKSKPKIVVGSGWWCDNASHDWAIGSDSTRTSDFFHFWVSRVQKYVRPDVIHITDSHSPIKPLYSLYSNLIWSELDRNYGQPNDIRVGKVKTKLSGFTRSVINGLMHAICCDADLYIYIEQDCVVHGDDIISAAIADSSSSVLLGKESRNAVGIEGKKAASMLQQSFMVFKKEGFSSALSAILTSPYTDGEMSPEEIMRKFIPDSSTIAIDYGRSRPINFENKHWYAQHLSDSELEEVLSLEKYELVSPITRLVR